MTRTIAFIITALTLITSQVVAIDTEPDMNDDKVNHTRTCEQSWQTLQDIMKLYPNAEVIFPTGDNSAYKDEFMKHTPEQAQQFVNLVIQIVEARAMLSTTITMNKMALTVMNHNKNNTTENGISSDEEGEYCNSEACTYSSGDDSGEAWEYSSDDDDCIK